MDEPRARIVRKLLAFFALSFAICWGLGALIIFARPPLETVVGPIGDVTHHWLYYLAVYSPTISAVACSAAFDGWKGLKALGARFVRPFQPVWLLVAVVLWPFSLVVYEILTASLGNGRHIDIHAVFFGMPLMALSTTALVLDPGGLGEETGWRGYALPNLLELFRPFAAGAFLGAVWGIWHLPAFFVSGMVQSRFGFGWFLLASTAFGLVMTWLYVRANGNVVIAGIVPHLVSNLAFDSHVFLRSAIETETIVMCLLVVLLFTLSGKDMWRRPPAALKAAESPAYQAGL